MYRAAASTRNNVMTSACEVLVHTLKWKIMPSMIFPTLVALAEAMLCYNESNLLKFLSNISVDSNRCQRSFEESVENGILPRRINPTIIN